MTRWQWWQQYDPICNYHSRFLYSFFSQKWHPYFCSFWYNFADGCVHFGFALPSLWVRSASTPMSGDKECSKWDEIDYSLTYPFSGWIIIPPHHEEARLIWLLITLFNRSKPRCMPLLLLFVLLQKRRSNKVTK